MDTYYWIFLLCIGFKILPMNTSESGLLEVLDHLSHGDGYLYPFPVQCSKILEEFAETSSILTMCSICYAKPIRLCTKCINQYVAFQKKYEELSVTVVNGTSCRSVFVSRDRLDAVLQYYDNILSVWDKGNCNACFNWSQPIPEIANSTKQFNKLYNATLQCIVDNLNPSSNNSEVVCEKCMQSYVRLDDYYKSLSTDSIGVDIICMDIVDSMNATRFIWSKNLNCCQLRRSPEIIFLCSTGIISILPLFYYLAVRFCGPIRDLPNVLKQSRFKQYILRGVNTRIN